MERREEKTKKVFEEIVAENFLNLTKTVSPQIYKAQGTSDRIKLHQGTA